jgi:excisionase family DNA binding protein
MTAVDRYEVPVLASWSCTVTRGAVPAPSIEEAEVARAEDNMRDDPRPPVGAGLSHLLLTTDEAADVLRVGRTTVYALIKGGQLRPVHIGRSCRISRAELERYVNRLDAPPATARPRPQRRAHPSAEQRSLFDDASGGRLSEGC